MTLARARPGSQHLSGTLWAHGAQAPGNMPARRRQQAAAQARIEAQQVLAVVEPNAPPMKRRFPTSKAGTLDCRTMRTIPSFDSQESKVCDASVCRGTEAIRFLDKPATGGDERFTSAQLQKYFQDLSDSSTIQGWMVPIHAWLVGLFTRHQHNLGIWGAVGEIGVFQGKLFIALSGFSHPSETIVAADWFDGGGQTRGYYEKFTANLVKYLGLQTSQMFTYQGDSNELTPQWFSERSIPYFRLLSIDASHDLKLVLRDFNLAACLMMDGGIVIADDFGSTSWMGVNAALYNFVLEQSRIVPFMLTNNKLYLTTVSHHAQYYEMVKALPDVVCEEEGQTLTQISLGDYRVCMLEHKKIGNADVDGLMTLLTAAIRPT
ncbi:hypothetical protein WJX73_001353 [Symbiochloris irregularis]|uniref:Uncharacterized protein n=1 Tax=Symbiochloris irregularis TaxID=706552 RepID=A0AAW1NVH9_9CHLO